MSLQHTKYSTDSSTVPFYASPSPSLLPQLPSAPELGPSARHTDVQTVQLFPQGSFLAVQDHLPGPHHQVTQFRSQTTPSQSKSLLKLFSGTRQAAVQPFPDKYTTDSSTPGSPKYPLVFLALSPHALTPVSPITRPP